MSIRNLLLSGGPAHDFPVTAALLAELLAEVGVETTVVESPAAALDALRDPTTGPDPGFELFTVLGLHWRMDQERYADRRAEHAFALSDADAAVLRDFVAAGRGLLALHAAVICFDAHPVWRELCGAAWDWERSSHPPVGDVTVAVTPAGRRHEITGDVGDFVVEDEVYAKLDVVADLDPLLVTDLAGLPAPLLWARRVGSGRVVTDVLGHGPESLQSPGHRTVLQRAARWAADAPAR